VILCKIQNKVPGTAQCILRNSDGNFRGMKKPKSSEKKHATKTILRDKPDD